MSAKALGRLLGFCLKGGRPDGPPYTHTITFPEPEFAYDDSTEYYVRLYMFRRSWVLYFGNPWQWQAWWRV